MVCCWFIVVDVEKIPLMKVYIFIFKWSTRLWVVVTSWNRLLVVPWAFFRTRRLGLGNFNARDRTPSDPQCPTAAGGCRVKDLRVLWSKSAGMLMPAVLNSSTLNLGNGC